MLINSLTFLSICLIVFWKLTDPREFGEKVKSYFSAKGILIGIYTFIFLSLNYLSGRFFPLRYSPLDGTVTSLGVLTFICGFGLSIWAKVVMGKSWGIPAEHNKQRQDKLIKTGPFRYSRNPIYVGLIMMQIGYGIAVQSYFTFLAFIPIFYFWESSKKEEKLLEAHFRKDYLKYKKDVPRFF